MRESTLSHEVEDVLRPVLNRDVLNFGSFEGDEFDDGTVKCRCFEFWRSAAFHIHDLATFIGNDERALKLTEVFGIDAEVSLERMLHLHSRRNVDERTTREDSAVERGEFIVTRRYNLSKPLFEKLRVFVKSLGGADKNDPLLADSRLDVRISGFAVKLGFHAGKELTLLLWNTQTLKGALHVLGNIIPRTLGLGSLGEIVTDILKNDVLQVMARPVSRHRHGLEFAQSVLTEFTNPIRILFNVANVIDCFLTKSDACIELVVYIVVKITDRTVNIDVRFCVHLLSSGIRLFEEVLFRPNRSRWLRVSGREICRH